MVGEHEPRLHRGGALQERGHHPHGAVCRPRLARSAHRHLRHGRLHRQDSAHEAVRVLQRGQDAQGDARRAQAERPAQRCERRHQRGPQHPFRHHRHPHRSARQLALLSEASDGVQGSAGDKLRKQPNGCEGPAHRGQGAHQERHYPQGYGKVVDFAERRHVLHSGLGLRPREESPRHGAQRADLRTAQHALRAGVQLRRAGDRAS